MPELRGKTFPGFIETTVDTETIRYKDKNREKQRQKMLAELKDRPPLPRRTFVKNKAWSKQTTKKERRKKRAAKRKHDEVFASIEHCDKTECVGGLNLFIALLLSFLCLQGSDVEDEDMKELLNDTRLLKKLKKGQISEEDFEKQITSDPKSKHRTEGPSHDSSEKEDV